MTLRRINLFAVMLLLGAMPALAQYIPKVMQDHWIVTKDLTEKSQGCYDVAHRKSLVGIKLAFNDHLLFWNGLTSTDLQPRELDLSLFTFEARFGLSPGELGIPTKTVAIVYVVPSVGIPVNAMVMRDANTILLDACNVWLEAARDPATPPLHP